MNKQRREESEMKGRGKHREKKEHTKKMSHGGSAHGDIGFTGERTKNTHNDYSGGEAVDRVLRGETPQTHVGTVHAAKGGSMCRMAAGGTAKVRKGQY